MATVQNRKFFALGAQIYDNDDMGTPFRQVAVFENGRQVRQVKLKAPTPTWLQPVLPDTELP